MEPTQLVSILKDGGPWGLLALSLWALRWIFQKYDALQEARNADGRVTAAALQASTKAVEEASRLIIAQGTQLQALAETQGTRLDALTEAIRRGHA